MICYKRITWEEILPIWKEHLTTMSTEPTSAMCFFLGYDNQPAYDLKNMQFTPTFWGAFHNDKLVGVNSGHMCVDRLYRSRGLVVFPEYRGLGLGQKLLMKTIAQAKQEKAIVCWSYPKLEIISTYTSVHFSRKNPYFNFLDMETIDTLNTRAAYIIDEKGIDAYHKEYYKKV